MDYTYNYIFVVNGKIVDILYSGKNLPYWVDTIKMKTSKKCQCCNQILKGEYFTVAGNYKIGDSFK